jgi:hypothetical protein
VYAELKAEMPSRLQSAIPEVREELAELIATKVNSLE